MSPTSALGSVARWLDRRADALGLDGVHVAVACLALLAAVASLAVSLALFPYHSLNHDEAVYLQQAATLLEGQLNLYPPVSDAFRPWFFVQDGARFYPKYAPVPAAIFALGEALVGSYRAALPAVAAAVVALTYAVTAEAFDRRTGVLSAGAMLVSPLFLLQTGVFLPYAPTAMLNLAFAWAYLRGVRTGDRRWHAAAGAAVGLAFFARPYTAVLFAAPFVVHAAWRLRGSIAPSVCSRGEAGRAGRSALPRHATTAALGLLGVGLTLAYNAVVTGSPLLFPYEAFAPADGLGFGRRALGGYERDYTPALALRANAEVVARLLRRWVPGGVAGTALATVGLASLARRAIPSLPWVARGDALGLLAIRRRAEGGRADRLDARLALAGVVLAVVAGNVYFWGNLNVLGSLGNPGDGLLAFLGPYYHFDALAPVAALAAHGALVGASWVRDRVAARGHDPARAARAGTAALVVAAAVVAGVGLVGTAAPIDRNADVTADYRQAYAPFADGASGNAVVLLPPTYGDWLAHPFQALRNDPGFDGPTVYALDRGGDNFAVVDAYPDRAYYRYVYRGAWTPTAGEPVDAAVQPVRAVSGETVTLDAALGVPAGVENASIRLAAGNDSAYYAVNGTPDRFDLHVVAGDGRVRLDGDRVDATGDGGVTLPDRGEVTVEVFLDYGAGSSVSYRLALPVERTDGGVRALSPYREVCRVPDRCGGAAAYLPSRARAGIGIRTALTAGNATAAWRRAIKTTPRPRLIRNPPVPAAGSTMSEGVHARVTVEPNSGCPLYRVGDEHAVTRLVPARGDDARPQVLVRGDADDFADVASVEPVVETERRVVCRLPDADCGGDPCLAQGFGFLPVQPYAVRWEGDRICMHVAAADRDEVRDVLAVLDDAGFDADLVGVADDSTCDPATLVVVDLSVLTARQREVARVAVERGYFDSDGVDADVLATDLGISKGTLSDHLREVRAELGEQLFPSPLETSNSSP